MDIYFVENVRTSMLAPSSKQSLDMLFDHGQVDYITIVYDSMQNLSSPPVAIIQRHINLFSSTSRMDNLMKGKYYYPKTQIIKCMRTHDVTNAIATRLHKKIKVSDTIRLDIAQIFESVPHSILRHGSLALHIKYSKVISLTATDEASESTYQTFLEILLAEQYDHRWGQHDVGEFHTHLCGACSAKTRCLAAIVILALILAALVGDVLTLDSDFYTRQNQGGS
jgi:hypothetical protein